MTDSMSEVRPRHLSDDALADQLRIRSAFVVLEFWSYRCEACRHNVAAMSKLAQAIGAEIDVFKINIDECPRITAAFAVALLPMVIVLHPDGTETRFTGLVTVEKVLHALDRTPD